MSEQQQLQGLSILLSLQHELRKLTSYRDFGFFVVNETYRLLHYQHAVLWQKKAAVGNTLLSLSGVANVDQHAPFNLWLLKCVRYCRALDTDAHIRVFTREDLPVEITRDWPQEAGEYLLWCPFKQEGFASNEGILFIRDEVWSSQELRRMEWLIQAYSYSWYFLCEKKTVFHWWKNLFQYKRKIALFSIIAVVAIMLFPVRQSVVAPAKVVAQNPTLITSPLEGVIKKIAVTSNQQVKVGQELFSMDDTDLVSNAKLARQEYEVALREYQRAVQKGFKEPASRAEVDILRATVQEKRLTANYADAILQKSIVKSPVAGTVIFDHKGQWLGKPVMTGEKIMQVATPNKVELEIWLPVADAIQFQRGSKIKLYLNGSPLQPLSATLSYASYEAELTPSNVLSYRLLAQFNPGEAIPRIGRQGSAKLYADYTIFIYYLLRRPLSTLRQTLGW